MGRQEVAAEIKRKKLVSETGVSGDTQRGSERLALCSQDAFHIPKTSESLAEGKRFWELVPFSPVPFAAFFSSLDSAQHAWRLGRPRFYSGSFLFII